MDTTNKQSLASVSLNRLIAFLVAGGFLFLFVETRIEHHDVLTEEFIAYVPILFSIIGFVLALFAAFQWQEKWIRVLHVYMFLALVTGLGGIFFHNQDRIFGEEKTTATAQQIEAEEVEEAGEPEEEEESEPPLLAPLAFTGLGIVGLLGTYRRWRAELIAKA